jgi:hypothetical protein
MSSEKPITTPKQPRYWKDAHNQYQFVRRKDNALLAVTTQQNRVEWGRKTLPKLLKLLAGYNLAIRDVSTTTGRTILKRNLRANEFEGMYISGGLRMFSHGKLDWTLKSIEFFDKRDRFWALSKMKKKEMTPEEKQEISDLSQYMRETTEKLRKFNVRITNEGKIPLFICPKQCMDKDVKEWMENTGKFQKSATFTKGYTQLLWIPNSDRMNMVIFDINIEDEPEASVRPKLQKLVNALQAEGYEPDILWTGKSYHVYVKPSVDYTYDEIVHNIISHFAIDAEIPLSGAKTHVKGQVAIDYPTQSSNRPIRTPLSIHSKTGLASILLNPSEITGFNPTVDSHPNNIDLEAQYQRLETLIAKYKPPMEEAL